MALSKSRQWFSHVPFSPSLTSKRVPTGMSLQSIGAGLQFRGCKKLKEGTETMLFLKQNLRCLKIRQYSYSREERSKILFSWSFSNSKVVGNCTE